MTSEKPVSRTVEDQAQKLAELTRLQLQNCRCYDDGEHANYTAIANVLFTLLYTSKAAKPRSRSLLGQLGLLPDMKFFSTVDEDGRSIARGGLVYASQSRSRTSVDSDDWVTAVGFVPLLSEEPGGVLREKLIDFRDWWGETVIHVPNREVNALEKEVSREDLICLVTDKDGGRHFDPQIQRHLERVLSENLIGIAANIRGKLVPPKGLVPASVRQIAHEFLLSLLLANPEAFHGRDYTFKKLSPTPFFDHTGSSPMPNASIPDISAREWLKFYAY